MINRRYLALLVVTFFTSSVVADECTYNGLVVNEHHYTAPQGTYNGNTVWVQQWGSAIADIGDVNGDGVLDLAIGDTSDTDGGDGGLYELYGAVWIYFMHADGSVIAAQKISALHGGFEAELNLFNDFGSAIAPLGDLDGDGVPDIAVGAAGDNNDYGAGFIVDGNGAVFVLFLNADGTVKDYRKLFVGDPGDWIEQRGGTDTFTGHGLAALGDLDGDGGIEIAVSSIQYNCGFDDPYNGDIWILDLHYRGRDNDLIESAQRISCGVGGFDGDLSGDSFFGYSVSRIGDLDGDGVTELAVGASRSFWILFLNEDGTVHNQRLIDGDEPAFQGEIGSHYPLGTTGDGIGDIDGDGVPDYVAAAPSDTDTDDAGENAEQIGAVWILLLNSDATVKTVRKISNLAGGFEGVLSNEGLFGIDVASLGDRNNDGYPEIAVGVPRETDDATYVGGMWILSLDPAVAACPSDVRGMNNACDPDGRVDVFDLLHLLESWNQNEAGADLREPYDAIDAADLLELLDAWGECQP